jgi:hypothetical protein
MAKKGGTDTDMGLAKIFEEIENFKSMCVKVGVTEDTGSQVGEDGATVAQYASWNELGTDDGRIPPRPFIRGFIDAKREQIGKTIDKLYGLVNDGQMDAMTTIGRLGEYGQSGIKSFIRHGDFVPNAESTVKKKTKGKGGKTTPLIDTGTMRNAIRYQIIRKPVGQVSE